MFSKKFILDTLERCLRSFAGGLAAQSVIGDAAVFSEAGFKYGLATAAASLILAVAGKPFGEDKDTGSVL